LTPTQKRNPNPKKTQILKGEAIYLLGNSNWIRLLFRNEVRIQVGFHKLHLLSLPTILHLGEDFSNLSRTPTNTWRNRHTISAKSTHDLGLNIPNEIDTQSRRNRHTTKHVPSNELPVHVQLIFTDLTRSKLSLSLPPATLPNSNINCKLPTSAQLLTGMHHTCLPYTSHTRTSIHADHRTCLQLSNYMTSGRTHHEPTLTLQLTGSLQFTCLS